MGRKLIDLGGQRYGRLIVLATTRTGGATFVSARCDCGQIMVARPHHLKNGTTQSCGCLRSESMRARQVKHDEADKTPEYRAWCGMKNRCAGSDEQHRRIYTRRGITVCAKWRHDFAAFLADVGRRPSPAHTLDRFPDNDGNYEPGNVRWATKSQQAKNRRTRRRVNGRFAAGVL